MELLAVAVWLSAYHLVRWLWREYAKKTPPAERNIGDFIFKL